MTLPLDEGWTARWAPGLADPALRAALLGSDRFGARIEGDLLEDLCGLASVVDPTGEESAMVEALAGQVRDEAVLRAGLCWCAPALATSLRPLAALPTIAPTRPRLRLILENRTHGMAGRVRRPGSADEVTSEGRRCLVAWLEARPAPIGARVRLRLAPELTERVPEPETVPLRTAAFDRALASLAEEAG